MADIDIKKIIADLGKTDWGVDNDAQFKATQLLKGLATSEDPLSNEFMKKLSDASNDIALQVLKKKADESKKEEKEDVKEGVLNLASKILEGMPNSVNKNQKEEPDNNVDDIVLNASKLM